ncbi:MAG: hypothetical protein JWN67_348 [Actinomycetia bacterium]|nr:hypothetical protein [Actinomycetes bacterium]
MLLAELEIWHSRPIAPTRRVALGRAVLPVEPAPGFGGLLLGGIVAAHIGELEDDLSEELGRLLNDLEAGRRIPQPRLHHRFQLDRHGLAHSRHRLLGHGDALQFEFESEGSPASQVLGAAYAAGQLDEVERRVVLAVVRRGARWHGTVGPELVRYLSGVRGGTRSARAFADPGLWALDVLGFASGASPGRSEVQRRFRSLLRAAHPDHGGAHDGAADRIADLAEARRILLHA